MISCTTRSEERVATPGSSTASGVAGGDHPEQAQVALAPQGSSRAADVLAEGHHLEPVRRGEAPDLFLLGEGGSIPGGIGRLAHIGDDAHGPPPWAV